MSKATVNRKVKGVTEMELRHRYLPWKFLKVILNSDFQKFISTDKQIFNIQNRI